MLLVVLRLHQLAARLTDLGRLSENINLKLNGTSDVKSKLNGTSDVKSFKPFPIFSVPHRLSNSLAHKIRVRLVNAW
jgi:hypothetical protein